jgi:hypothetical protein
MYDVGEGFDNIVNALEVVFAIGYDDASDLNQPDSRRACLVPRSFRPAGWFPAWWRV